MSRKKRIRCEKARRALFDLQELVVDVLEENSQGLEPGQIGAELDILPTEAFYAGGHRTNIVWGILHGLVRDGLVEKSESRAFLSSRPPAG